MKNSTIHFFQNVWYSLIASSIRFNYASSLTLSTPIADRTSVSMQAYQQSFCCDKVEGETWQKRKHPWQYRADPENSERRDRVPHSAPPPPPPPRMKTSLQPDCNCIIITTLEKRLEGLGSYKNVLKIQEKKGSRDPLAPSPKSAYGLEPIVKGTYVNINTTLQILITIPTQSSASCGRSISILRNLKTYVEKYNDSG